MKTGEPTPSLDFWALTVMLWVHIYKHCTHFCSSRALVVMLWVFVYYLVEIYPLWQLLYGQFLSVTVFLSENGATHTTSKSVLTNAVISSGWCMGISNVNIPCLCWLAVMHLFALFRGIYLPALLHLEMTPVCSFVFFNAFVFIIL